MATAEQIKNARANGYHGSQFDDGTRHVSVNEVVNLLAVASENAHPAVRRSANRLLQLMSEREWDVSSGAKKGGTGGRRGKPDMNLHTTVRVKNKKGQYHLHLSPNGFLRRVTNPDDPEVDVLPPYVPPGAVPPE